MLRWAGAPLLNTLSRQHVKVMDTCASRLYLLRVFQGTNKETARISNSQAFINVFRKTYYEQLLQLLDTGRHKNRQILSSQSKHSWTEPFLPLQTKEMIMEMERWGSIEGTRKAPQSLFNKKQQPEWKRETKTHLGLVRKECNVIEVTLK